MHPDAHLHIHRSEQAVRARVHLRTADRPPRVSRTLSSLLTDLFGHRAVTARGRSEGTAFSP